MGGLAFILPRDLRKHATQLNCKSWRLQALNLKIGNEIYLIINSYLPTDQRTGVVNQEVETVLAEVGHLISSTRFDALYVLGDLNCDFARDSSHVDTVEDFIHQYNLFTAWNKFQVDFTHMSENKEGVSFTSTIDHILTLQRDEDKMVNAGVIHRVENTSDHELIYGVINVSIIEIPNVKNHHNSERTNKGKPSWSKASVDQKLEYNDLLFRRQEFHQWL